MPIYQKAITALTTHTKALPLETIWKLNYGIITQFQVSFHKGARGTAKAVVKYHEFQVLPLNPDEEFKGEGEISPFSVWIPLDVRPYDLKLVVWTVGAAYNHEIIFRCNVLPRIVAMPYLAIERLIDILTPKRREEEYPI